MRVFKLYELFEIYSSEENRERVFVHDRPSGEGEVLISYNDGLIYVEHEDRQIEITDYFYSGNMYQMSCFEYEQVGRTEGYEVTLKNGTVFNIREANYYELGTDGFVVFYKVLDVGQKDSIASIDRDEISIIERYAFTSRQL